MSGYKTCVYANMTKFGLICDYSTGILGQNDKYPCPEDSGTNGKRNGICYSYCAFDKDDETDKHI
jgi:hypothetical protein